MFRKISILRGMGDCFSVAGFFAFIIFLSSTFATMQLNIITSPSVASLIIACAILGGIFFLIAGICFYLTTRNFSYRKVSFHIWHGIGLIIIGIIDSAYIFSGEIIVAVVAVISLGIAIIYSVNYAQFISKSPG